MKPTLVILAAAVLGAGCASGIARVKSGTTYERYQPYLGTPVDQFTAFRVDHWELAGPYQVVLWTGVNDAHLLTVWDSCNELNFAERIGVTSTGSSITKFDSVRVRGQRCPIKEIRRIDVKQMKSDQAAMRAKATAEGG
ncbi:MAG: DUF6491 family protein [Steroidobacteraceae bacterium]